MKTLNKKELIVREYEYKGKKGRYLTSRQTGAGCLLEGSAVEFFDIAHGSEAQVEARLAEMAAMFGVDTARIAKDYETFVAGLEKTLGKDKKSDAKLLPALAERGLTALVMLELLHPCNLKCVHCYVGNRGGEEDYRSLVVKKLDVLKRKLMEMGCPEITVTGGEIRMVPGITGILKELSSDFIVVALTNGTMWTEEDCKELAAAGVREIRATLFSHDPKVHDAITCDPGSWQKTFDFAMTMKRLGAPIGINTPALAANIKDIPALVEKMKQAGLRCVVDAKCFQGLGAKNCRAGLPELTELYRSGLVPKLNKTVCGGIIQKVRIGPDGTIFPCEYLSDKIGNIFEDRTMADIRASEPVKKMLGVMAQPPSCEECAGCSAKDKCFNCIAFNYGETGDHLKPSRHICDLNRICRQLESA
ncbi:MAG: radical SAM protein [Elusimicrobiales bacterium]|nr:radical SAM protein [Elusimicrobiales bacterium]